MTSLGFSAQEMISCASSDDVTTILILQYVIHVDTYMSR